MNIDKAFCHELGRSINITEARNEYFRQDLPRKRYTFSCSSPECKGDVDVTIIGVNYDKVIIDDASYVQAHFRSKDVDTHSADCDWVIEEEAKIKYVDEASSNLEKKERRKRVTESRFIEVSTFLSRGKLKKHASAESVRYPKQESSFQIKVPSKRSKRLREATERIERAHTSSSFSELVSNYLEISREKNWEMPLSVESCSADTYGKFFKKLEWYNQVKAEQHVYFGSVKVDKVYPSDFDFNKGLPSGIVLKFHQKVTVGDTSGSPTLYITKGDFDESTASHVLAESIKAAYVDDSFSNYLWCHFHGRIDEVERVGRNDESYTVLDVIPTSIDTIELIPFKRK